jgi:hypothetical protein
MHQMKRFTASALTLILVTAALSGCGKSTKPASPINTVGMNGATAVDIAKASDAISANPAYVDESLYADATPMTFSAGSAVDLDGPGTGFHRPLRWWRTISSISRSVDLTFGDPDSTGRPTTALATVHRHILGNFHVVLADSTASDSLRRIVVKPLDDSWTRLLALHRRHVTESDDTTATGDRDDWRIVGTSGVLVTSAGATVGIQSVRIQAGSLDTTITDPLALHRLRRFECFHSLQLVHLTVTTGHNDDIVAFYRDGDRRPFTSNGDGTYTIDFLGWDFGGLRHVGVNAFARGTITSDTYPYDSQAWLVPFVARDGDAQIEHH